MSWTRDAVIAAVGWTAGLSAAVGAVAVVAGVLLTRDGRRRPGGSRPLRDAVAAMTAISAAAVIVLAGALVLVIPVVTHAGGTDGGSLAARAGRATGSGTSGTGPTSSGPTSTAPTGPGPTSTGPTSGSARPTAPTSAGSNAPVTQVTVDELQAGDCIQALPEQDPLDKVPRISCDAPHEVEVLSFAKLSTGAYPGTTTVQQRSYQLCRTELNSRRLKLGLPAGSLVATFIWPGAEDWSNGVRESICLVSAADGSDLEGPLDKLVKGPPVATGTA